MLSLTDGSLLEKLKSEWNSEMLVTATTNLYLQQILFTVIVIYSRYLQGIVFFWDILILSVFESVFEEFQDFVLKNLPCVCLAADSGSAVGGLMLVWLLMRADLRSVTAVWRSNSSGFLRWRISEQIISPPCGHEDNSLISTKAF